MFARLRFVTLALVVSVCCVASAAPAAEPVPAPLAESLTGEAKASYNGARLLFDDGDSAGALAKFKHAYEVSRDPRLLWNMAVCEKELRHYSRAAALIDRYLKEGEGHITAEQRQSAADTQDALHAFYSSVKLEGAPDGATVLVDGAVIGPTPLSMPLLLDLGPRTLRVEQSAFEPFETKLDVPGGSEITVTVQLRAAVVASALPAHLSVITSGARDTISVDGKVVGAQQWEGALALGEHTLLVTAVGKKPYRSRLQLKAGDTRNLQVTLDNEARPAPVWLWITGGAVLAAGAVVGGYFLFKPRDTTPGAHPEGKLSTVYLPVSAGLP